MAAALSAARPFRLGRTSPRSSSAVSENSSDHRSATRGTAQNTARDVRSGLLFWAFAQQRSASASAVFASRIQQHLDRYGVSLRDLVWQTDNGGEFKGDFPKALGDSQHVRIPPAAHTYQSDVETVHRLEEDEFFDLEDFTSRGDFLAKVHTYQLYFNLVRPNSHKENQSPWQIIERLTPRSALELCLLPPVFLDYYLNDSGGYDVGRLPSMKIRDFSKLGPILEGSIQDGITDFRSLTYSLSDEEAAKKKAVAEAMRRAVGRANAALEQKGQKVGALRFANLDVKQLAGVSRMDVYQMAQFRTAVTQTVEVSAGGAGYAQKTPPPPPPLPQPEKITVSATVQCAFQIQ